MSQKLDGTAGIIAHVRRSYKRKIRAALAKLVRRVVSRRKGLSPEQTYRSAWAALNHHLTFKFLLLLTPRHGPKNHFRYRTHELLIKNVKGYYPKIVIPDNFASLVKSDKPFVVITFHDGFNDLYRVFYDCQRQHTRIAGPNKYRKRTERIFGTSEYLDVVQDDILSLIFLRNAVEKGHAICCAIDYADRGGKKKYANPALIDFANRFNLNMLFIKTNVTEAGDVELLCWGPYSNIEPERCVRMFIDHFNSTGETRINLEIKRYVENNDNKKRVPKKAGV